MSHHVGERPSAAAGLMYGVGLGGFVDGIVMHQLLQGRLPPSWRFHLGGVLAGWGGFDVVEGLVDHQLLGVHHVRDDLGGPLSWDLGFLALGVALVLAGWLVARSGSRALSDRGWEPVPASGAGGG